MQRVITSGVPGEARATLFKASCELGMRGGGGTKNPYQSKYPPLRAKDCEYCKGSFAHTFLCASTALDDALKKRKEWPAVSLSRFTAQMTFHKRLGYSWLTVACSGFFCYTIRCRTFSILCSVTVGIFVWSAILKPLKQVFLDWYIFWLRPNNLNL